MLKGFYLFLASLSSSADFIVDDVVIVSKGELICSYEMMCSNLNISIDEVKEMLVKLVIGDYISIEAISSKKDIFSIKFVNREFFYEDEYIKYQSGF